ncbi:MAG: septation ring formation regulator EzrA [Bacteroidetes bacterium SW_4_67_19]|nr:MAG: septation ring formation regulator EzrA [Bacteroidetes bacterium SW_4_67_19]
MPEDASASFRPGRWLLLAAAGLALVWVAFFVRFHQQHAALTTENDSLRRRIEALQRKLEHPPADSTVERIAREEYGMKRPGETVYRVE